MAAKNFDMIVIGAGPGGQHSDQDLAISHQPGQATGAAGKSIGLDSHLLEHADKDIAERRVDLAIERKVLAMLEASPREDDGQIRIVMNVRVPHVTAVKDHGVIQQGAIRLFHALKVLQQIA